jgi:hypothetical protein
VSVCQIYSVAKGSNPSTIHIVVGICKEIAILALYQVSCQLVTLLKFIYSTTQVSNVLGLTVYCKIINFIFQIFPLFIPEMPARFTSFIVQIIPIYLAWIL